MNSPATSPVIWNRTRKSLIPLMKNERFIGVLDLDSPQLRAVRRSGAPPGWKHSLQILLSSTETMSVKTPIIVAVSGLSSNTGRRRWCASCCSACRDGKRSS